MSNQCMTAECNGYVAQCDRKLNWSNCLAAILKRWALARRQRRLNRQTVAKLTSLDDATLKDIGLSRGDVSWAGHLPDTYSSAVELEIIARRRSANTR